MSDSKVLEIAALVNGYHNDGTTLTAAETLAAIAKVLGKPMEAGPSSSPREGLEKMAARAEMGFSERFEVDAERFYGETGLIAPGRSVPLAMCGYDQDRREAEWTAFCERLKFEAIATLREAALALQAAEQTCQWSQDDAGGDELWETQCKHAFYFDGSDGPEDCGFKRCPYCGKKLIEARTSADRNPNG